MRRKYSDHSEDSYEYASAPRDENYDNGQGYEQYPEPRFFEPNPESNAEYANAYGEYSNEAYTEPYAQYSYEAYAPEEYGQDANAAYGAYGAYGAYDPYAPNGYASGQSVYDNPQGAYGEDGNAAGQGQGYGQQATPGFDAYGGYYDEAAPYGYGANDGYAQAYTAAAAQGALEYEQDACVPLQAGDDGAETGGFDYYDQGGAQYDDSEYGYEEQPVEASPKKKRNRRAVITLIAGLTLMIGGAALFLYPIGIKAYNAYVVGMDANAFLKGLGNRSNYKLIDETNLAKAEVINIPAQYVDDTFIEDENDYYNSDGTARTDVGAVSSRGKPESYAVLEIPKINLSIGMYVCDYFKQIYTHMRYGAGIYPGSAMPGTIGNCAVAAHRTGPSDFFRRLDELKAGDQMIVHTVEASYKYIVEDSWTIFPSDTSVIKPTDYAALTLTTCQAYKGVSNGKRLIIRGRLKEFASD